jgi:hypothetical protein
MDIPLNILMNLNNKKELNHSNEKPQYRRYWPTPNLIQSTVEYQNVNVDLNLRKDVTDFFHKKVIKWINNYPEFAQYKSKLSSLKTIDGQLYIYNLLRKFIKKSGINWYDLRDNYSIVKQYINVKLYYFIN